MGLRMHPSGSATGWVGQWWARQNLKRSSKMHENGPKTSGNIRNIREIKTAQNFSRSHRCNHQSMPPPRPLPSGEATTRSDETTAPPNEATTPPMKPPYRPMRKTDPARPVPHQWPNLNQIVGGSTAQGTLISSPSHHRQGSSRNQG